MSDLTAMSVLSWIGEHCGIVYREPIMDIDEDGKRWTGIRHRVITVPQAIALATEGVRPQAPLSDALNGDSHA